MVQNRKYAYDKPGKKHFLISNKKIQKNLSYCIIIQQNILYEVNRTCKYYNIIKYE